METVFTFAVISKLFSMKYLSPESRAWLEKDDNLRFADYFVGLATDARDRKWRKAAMEIAVQWCILYERGEDGKDLHPTMKTLIKPFLDKDSESEDPAYSFWAGMCGHAAAYRFAGIDKFDLTGALYGIYRMLLPEERDIEPFDEKILEKLLEESGIDTESDKQFGYAIKTNGLDSEIIMHGPPEANAWTEYADQYRLVLLNL